MDPSARSCPAAETLPGSRAGLGDRRSVRWPRRSGLLARNQGNDLRAVDAPKLSRAKPGCLRIVILWVGRFALHAMGCPIRMPMLELERDHEVFARKHRSATSTVVEELVADACGQSACKPINDDTTSIIIR